MAKLWGGRFSKPTNKLVEEFTKSIHFDQKLAKYDCLGSLAHITILKKAGILSGSEFNQLDGALKNILKTIENGSFFKKIDSSFEDIHSYIQDLVEKKAGKAAAKFHSCRSRNDQIVLDMKLFLLDELLATHLLTNELIKSLHSLGQKNKNVYVPGFTHLQHAIPVSLINNLGAYEAMLERDNQRLKNIWESIELTFGAGSVAGTMIDASKYSVKINGITKLISAGTNSIDAVSDRDFIIETLSTLAIIGTHLSRLAEDMILWASKEFDFIDIDDAFCTGSSLMPQKKNPDVLELVRGYSGRLNGNLINVLTMIKGLPLSYNRDMQLDKEPLFDSLEIVQKELAVLAELFKNVSFKKDNIAKQLQDESLYATDLADYLVKNKVPFKQAHSIIGQLIREKLESGIDLRHMNDKTLKSFHPLLNSRIVSKIINPAESVKSKKSIRRK